jgi:hypothetical protein
MGDQLGQRVAQSQCMCKPHLTRIRELLRAQPQTAIKVCSAHSPSGRCGFAASGLADDRRYAGSFDGGSQRGDLFVAGDTDIASDDGPHAADVLCRELGDLRPVGFKIGLVPQLKMGAQETQELQRVQMPARAPIR